MKKNIKRLFFTICLLFVCITFNSCALKNTTTNNIVNNVTNDITNKVVDYEEITITTMNDALQMAVERAEKAVVGVSLKSVTSMNNGGTSVDSVSVGSGVIYKAEENYDGDKLVNYTYYAITNRHVIEETSIKNPKVYIYLGYEDVQVEATILGYDQKVDLACLKFNHTTFIDPVEFGDSESIKKGSLVIAIGNPEGFDYFGSATLGIVSSPLRYLSSDTDNDGMQDFNSSYIQHDASINPGNSGGGLFTIDGKLIGINTIKIVSSDVDNMGFAIPSNDVKYLIENYLEKGLTFNRPRLGVIGIEARVLTPSIIDAQGLKALPDIYELNKLPYGIYVTEIISGGSISGSGVKAHDIILEFDGVKLTTNSAFSALVNTASKYQIGSSVEITYYSRSSNSILKTTITLKGE